MKKTIKTILAFSALSLTSFSALSYDHFENENIEIKSYNYIVKLVDGYNLGDLEFDLDNINGVNLKTKRKIVNNYYVIRFNGLSDIDYKSYILSLGYVDNVEVDSVIKPNFDDFKSEPLYPQQYYMFPKSEFEGASGIESVKEKTQMPSRLPADLDDLQIINQRPTIAILDTGILDHDSVYFGNIINGYKFSTVYAEEEFYDPSNIDAELKSNYFKSGSNYEDFNRYAYVDDEGFVELNSCIDSHGTAMAGLIGAPINGEGIAGIADVNFVIGKVLDTDCSSRGLGTRGLVSDLASAIQWATGFVVEDYDGLKKLNKPSDIILVASSSYADEDGQSEVSCPDFLQESIDAAVSMGSIVVTSTGNNGGSNASSVPANCDNVLTIGSNGLNGLKSDFSNTGFVDFSVLGEDILVPDLNVGNLNQKSNYKTENGTSNSASIFSGMLGLLKYNFKNFDYGSIKGIITDNIDPLNDSSCFNNNCGKGVVDLDRVLDDIVVKLSFEKEKSNYFGLTEEGTCESFLQKAIGEHIDICSIYNVEIQNDNEIEGFSYKIFSRMNIQNFWSFSGNSTETKNTNLISEYLITENNINDPKTLYIKDLDLTTFDYALGYCSPDFCYPLIDLDFSTMDEEDIPLECR